MRKWRDSFLGIVDTKAIPFRHLNENSSIGLNILQYQEKTLTEAVGSSELQYKQIKQSH